MGYKEKWILKYLDEFYTIDDNTFYGRDGNIIFGVTVLDNLHKIFGFDKEIVANVVQRWGESNGVTDWEKARGRELKWTTTISDAMSGFGLEGQETAMSISDLAIAMQELELNIPDNDFSTDYLLDIYNNGAVNHTWENTIQPRRQDD